MRAMLLNIRKFFDFGGLEQQRRDGFEKNKKRLEGFSNTIVVVAIIEPPPHWIESHEHISVEPPTHSVKFPYAVNV